MPSLPLVKELNDGQYPQTVHLSPSSVTLIMSGLTFLFQLWRWQGDDGYELTTSEIDEVDAMTAKLAEEMMKSMVGQIFLLATYPPEWCLECNGDEYARADYPALYDAIESVFHVDSDTFRVPNLAGQVAIGRGTSPNGYSYGMDDSGGSEEITLDTSQIPSHNHAASDAGHDHMYAGATPTVLSIQAGVPVASAIPAALTVTPGFADISVDNTGGDGSHENRPPYRALRYVIVAF